MTSLEILERSFRGLPCPQEHPRMAPVANGVYLLVHLDEIVYVGSSTDVVHRLYKHFYDGKSFTRALFVALPHRVHHHYEGAFIRALKPRDNKYAPRGFGYDAEILDGFGIGHLLSDDWKSHVSTTREPAVIRKLGPLASRLRDERLRRRLSMEAFGELLGVTRQAVSLWETGRTVPSTGNLELFAARLDMSVAELWTIQ